MNFHKLITSIEDADTITIFRHENPDCDALGSQFAFKTWLEENFPKKHVYALGYQTTSQATWPKSDNVEESVIQSSLAIVLDTANAARIDDQRCLHAKEIIKIDHHPNKEPFGNLMFVDETCAATCEILTLIFDTYKNKYTFSKQVGEYLYRGLLTDTLNYTTSNTTPQTLRVGATLASLGIQLSKISHDVFDNSLNGYRFHAYIITHTQIIHDGLAYVLIPEKDYTSFNFNASKARSFVDKLGNVKDFQIWAIFTEKKDQNGNILYDASLRAKEITINDVAEMFHGGGHKCAAGVKNLSEQQVHIILEMLDKKLRINS